MMPPIARSMTQDTGRKMQAAIESLAFIQAFIAEIQPVAHDDTADELYIDQLFEHAAAADGMPSPDTLRRLITRVECLA